MDRKLVFIDDAGDVGFKIGHGSTDYFAVAVVFFDNNFKAEEGSLRIHRLRRSLGWHDLHEFKFRKASAVIKNRFFETVSSLDFQVVVALIDKKSITDTKMQKNPGEFYFSVISQAIKAGGDITKAYIYIDGEAGRDHRRKAKVFIRHSLPERSVSELRFRDSRKNNLIQLADMIAGAVLHSSENRDDAETYISMIKERIITKITKL
jgi:hypothetical protein